MVFIELTDLEGNSMFINFAKVELFNKHREQGTKIYFTGDEMSYARVRESTEEISARLSEAFGKTVWKDLIN